MSTVFNFTFVPWFRSVAPYIHTHRGKTFVVGIAGEAIAAGKLQHIAQDLALIQSMGVKVVLVHGFRPQVNEQLKAKGHEAKYSHGMRITDEVALDSAQEAAGQLRYEIEAAFSQGLPNTPMAGSTVRVISGNFITARPVGILDGVDFKHSGLVRKVDVAAITQTLNFGAMVLLSPFGFSPTGEAFNLTMEEVATSVAIAMQADKLIFLTEVPGTTRSTPNCRWRTPKNCCQRWGRGSTPPTPRFTCSIASRPARAASIAATSCRLPLTARCCLRFMSTTASAPW
jgi:amino-acid N-acetyltransferase